MQKFCVVSNNKNTLQKIEMSYSKQRELHSLPGCIFCSNWDMCKVKSDSIKKCSSVCLHSLLLCSPSPLRLKTSLKARHETKGCRAELKKKRAFFPQNTRYLCTPYWGNSDQQTARRVSPRRSSPHHPNVTTEEQFSS